MVVVAATDGRVSNDDVDRLTELHSSASILGVHRVECLGYADSGFGPEFPADPPGRVRFARADAEEAAGRLARILCEEDADLLLSYQANGGYGHRDHVRVHQVGKRARQIAATPRVLEATMPREMLTRIAHVAHALRLPAPYGREVVRTAYSPGASITHRINVFGYARQKRDALAAHRSQIGASASGERLFGALMRLPPQVAGLMLGREWFVDPALPPGRVHRDIFG